MDNYVVRIVERQFDFVLEASDESFFGRLRHALEVMKKEPLVAPHLNDLRLEVELAGERISHNELIPKIIDMRGQLGRLVPELAGIWGERADMVTRMNPDWFNSLECFDAIASGENLRVPGLDEHLDASAGRRLIALLRINLQRAIDLRGGSSGALADLDDRLDDLNELYEYGWRNYVDTVNSHGGNALIQIESMLAQINPPPRSRRGGDKRLDRLNDYTREVVHSATFGLRDVLYGGAKSDEKWARLADSIKPWVRTFREGLIARIGTRVSLNSVFNRFQARCEQHDAERLRGLVDIAKSKSGKPEDVLRDQLALWLFDQGLNPVTEPRIGNLRPDLLDPGVLYVEAKQYQEPAPRSKVIRGMYQVYDTFRRLRISHPEVTEGFYVVFRRGGPLVIAPPVVRSEEGWTVHLKFVDIASGDIGSGQKHQPVRISLEELSPKGLPPEVEE